VGDAKPTELTVFSCPDHCGKPAVFGAKYATTLAVRWTLQTLFGAALALSLSSCTTPTLPLPPPTEPSITTSTIPGKVHFHGQQSVHANALVIAFNENPAVPRADRVTGTQADDTGTWDMDVTASPKDVIEITQETGDTRSPSIDVTVPSPK